MNKKLANGSRRNALVETAFDIIAKEGFEGLRLREVASKVGIDHSTLHHYFDSKPDLIAAVVDYATKQFRSKFLADDARHHRFMSI